MAHQSLVLLVLCVALLLTGSHAQSFQLARCRKNNRVQDACDVRSICQRCVRTEDCVFDMTTQECGLANWATSSGSGSTNATVGSDYCDDNDSLCLRCGTAPQSCRGLNGCTCTNVCDMLMPMQLACQQRQQTSVLFIAVAGIVALLPCLLIVQRGCSRRAQPGMRTEWGLPWRRGRSQAARRRDTREPSGPTLQLDAWRTHRDQYKMEMENIELTSCYALVEGETHEDHDVVSKDSVRRSMSSLDEETKPKSVIDEETKPTITVEEGTKPTSVIGEETQEERADDEMKSSPATALPSDEAVRRTDAAV
ncbi:hypothetical protein Poli38472_006199 [Pythium oligandrum]|uniref:Uncharacterized protein n=1 Tax=Pythium oligandrum TaxID=41045 RepID=A0A8K1FMW8_PYTOL|nr:hypothetical protein Poli38472_006199 [Pythium oligandrum]|eukprot:TMW68731.1 hypothetical protein Poli38472_006199 [Pythium oligandrum]